jgi:hypothetical protein
MTIAFLVRTSHDLSGKCPAIVLLHQDITTLGRHGDVRIDTPNGHEISRVHAAIIREKTPEQTFWVIKDTNSLNGTFVNSRKILARVLQSGDQIVFGGGAEMKTGDLLPAVQSMICRYVFCIQAPRVMFAPTVRFDVSAPSSECESSCPVCYMTMAAKQVLPCGHVFCPSCVLHWVKHCELYNKPTTCPMCRAFFVSSHVGYHDVSFHRNLLIVLSLDPTMRELKMADARSVRHNNIFAEWTGEQKRWFWRAFARLKEWHHRLIFLHLTKATLSYIMNATDSDLRQAMHNFDLPHSETDRQENLRRLLLELHYRVRFEKKKQHP